ncbi:MAG: CHASE2 domain-containing protein, partial [Candidatus Omnitrophica bacterium]|nr:CHASE2 domain-containing protein [Candidatus Omnitrophota bacterium]
MNEKRRKKFLISAALGLVAALLTLAFNSLLPESYEIFETKTLDARFKVRGPLSQDGRILFLEMDETSINALGRWPWPRDIFAHITETLQTLDARAVLFDVTFSNPTQLIVDKERLREGLKLEENAGLLRSFIGDTQQLLDQEEPQTQEAVNALSQLRDGIGVWQNNIQETLSLAMQDNDLLLSRAFKDAGNVYLGYNFEILRTARDIEKNTRYLALKDALRAWCAGNPAQDFRELPSSLLAHARGLSAKELHTAFMRARLYTLISRNLELSFNDAAASFEAAQISQLRPHYNDIKAEVYRDTLQPILAAKNDTPFKEIIWQLNLFRKEDIALLEQEYNRLAREDALAKKAGIPFTARNEFFKALQITPPILPFIQSMKSAGFLNAIADYDGTLRKVPLLVYYNGRVFPHIALHVLFDLWNIDPLKSFSMGSDNSLIVGTRRIPVDKNGCLLINWPGKWHDSFRHLSASEVYRLWELQQNLQYNLQLSQEELRDQALKEMLIEDQRKLDDLTKKLSALIKDSICIIGLTAPGTHDYTPIPLESDYPAVGTHAAILNTILNEKFLQRMDTTNTNFLILFLSITVALCVSAMSAAYSLIFIIVVLALYATAAFQLFATQGLWIDMVGPLGSTLLSYIVTVSYHFASEEKEKRWVKKAFGHYISKNVMEEILKDPSRLTLGGERRELTVLFSDIRGFTAYSEKRQPEEVVAMLNEYFDAMSA